MTKPFNTQEEIEWLVSAGDRLDPELARESVLRSIAYGFRLGCERGKKGVTPIGDGKFVGWKKLAEAIEKGEVDV